jgi:DNA-binding LacI/PurR family transcriptional regulator
MTAHRPTLDTVAAAAGVSRMTVSNAYNRPDQLSATTRERVLEVARALGYSGPDPAAQSLRRGRTGTVGVVLTERLPYAFADPGMVSILRGIATELSDAGFALLLVPSAQEGDAALVRQVIVDALVLCSLAEDDPEVAAAVERQVPLVTIGHPQLTGVPRISIDSAHATTLPARHLYELGHRRYLVLDVTRNRRLPAGLVPNPGMHERTTGFVQALVALGLSATDVEVCYAEAHTRAAAAAPLAEMLQRPARQRPTAIFAVTDVLALGAMAACTTHGLHVPDDISVVGFDGIEEGGTSAPPLTTVMQSLFEQGRLAAQLAVRRIAGEPVRGRRVGADLVVRGSTARARR